jgi:hypothetical protein
MLYLPDNYARKKSKEAKIKADSVQNQLNQAISEGDQLSEVQQARVDADNTTYLTLKERLDTEQMANRTEFTTKRLHLDTKPTDTDRTFEIHNMVGQGVADKESEVTHHYTDASAKIIDNVGSGTILLLNNGRNPIMRPDKPTDFVGSGKVLLYRKFNLGKKTYDEIFEISHTGNIKRRGTTSAFTLQSVGDSAGYNGFVFDNVNAGVAPFQFRNGGHLLSIQDETNKTKATFLAGTKCTSGMELRTPNGNIYLNAPTGDVQMSHNGTLYPIQPVISGTTANRPTTNLVAGFQYFDTDLNKPIWRNAANDGWVDATGEAV